MNIKSFCIITLMSALLCACGSNKSNEIYYADSHRFMN